MTPDDPHPSDALDLLLDGRLPPPRRAEVEAHLAACTRCRKELAALRWVKAAMRERVLQVEVPAEVAARVSAGLDAEVRAARRASRRRWTVGLALAGAAAAIVVLRTARPDFVTAAERDFAAYTSAALALELETDQPPALERHFAQRGIRFPIRVFDFGMMEYQLAGGRVHRLAGRQSVLFAYRGARGKRLLCTMYEGRLAELPTGAEEREHEGIRFLIYRSGDLTLVFWQEGSVVCVLTSDGDPEEAVQLAYAKAIKV